LVVSVSTAFMEVMNIVRAINVKRSCFIRCSVLSLFPKRITGYKKISLLFRICNFE
jgi:hypothetical protein